MSVALFSPIRCSPEVLRKTLPTWFALENVDTFWCYDDNAELESSALLKKFEILPKREFERDGYGVTEQGHHWPGSAVARVAQIKDDAIRAFLKTGNSHLILIDADVAVHPGLLRHLLALDLPLVSEVFWSQWTPSTPFLPNCWDFQPYGFYRPETILRLRNPGQFLVGGLGACTLIHRKVLDDGAQFKRFPSLPPNWGEDRDFCLRAQGAGWPLMIDTEYPCFHVYRPSLLPQLDGWQKAGCHRNWFSAWLNTEWESQIRKLLN